MHVWYWCLSQKNGHIRGEFIPDWDGTFELNFGALWAAPVSCFGLHKNSHRPIADRTQEILKSQMNLSHDTHGTWNWQSHDVLVLAGLFLQRLPPRWVLGHASHEFYNEAAIFCPFCRRTHVGELQRMGSGSNAYRAGLGTERVEVKGWCSVGIAGKMSYGAQIVAYEA